MTTTDNFKTAALQFAPGVHIYLLDQERIQIGLDPQSSLRLPAQLHSLLKKCDGYTTVEKILDLAQLKQLDRNSIEQILNMLVVQGLLIKVNSDLTNLTSNQQSHHLDASRAVNGNAELITKRANIRISVVGAGRIGSTLTLILGNSGFSNIRVFDSKPVSLNDLSPWGYSRLDIGLRRDFVLQTMLERIHRGQLKSMRSKETRSKPDLIIYTPDPLADLPWLAPDLADWAMQIDVPYFVISGSPKRTLVTSIIHGANSGCLRCYHLHQVDRDEVWPRLVSQLMGKEIPDPTPTSLVLQSALFGYEQITNWLIGQTESNWHSIEGVGEVAEFSLPLHRECGCLWQESLEIC